MVDYLIIKGYCLYKVGCDKKLWLDGKETDNPAYIEGEKLRDCKGQVSTSCLGSEGKMCSFFGYTEIDKQEEEKVRKALGEESDKI